METIEKQAREECQKIQHFFDFTIGKMIDVSGVEQVAGVPPGTLLNLLTKGEMMNYPHTLNQVVVTLAKIGYKPRWDWDYIIQHDL